ncbi:gamma-glutamyl phosphate reductase [Faecalicoccus pleomorphus]|uniref:Gamma-glutamyl phosphate reductase n=1 Tax=Faecalicoccus pleomorphus TaxID=1323 RepID=A0A380LJT6_9FIRM|nr:glutamate-5-semialdehyde dehydrogenase [Faecalicoccus pleomorphus]SUO03507.1 gamma-glutamyl phosphate reductase [Faecalicoccus pleomorphus]
MNLEQIGIQAKKVSYQLASLSTEQKNQALQMVSSSIWENRGAILEANRIDMENGRKKRLSDGLLDRLQLTEQRITDMAKAVWDIIRLEDPVGEVLDAYDLENGLHIEKKRVPIGVIGIIYEARPNVTLDAFSICFKTGNAVILKGGSDAIHSNIAITKAIQEGLKQAGVCINAIQFIESTSHEDTQRFMQMTDYVDVIIPRGSKRLIQSVMQNAKVPVIETGAGNCHIYIDETADIQKAVDIVFNAKTQRIGVCNAAESLLVHKNIAAQVLPLVQKKLNEKEVLLKCDEISYDILKNQPGRIEHATKEDWSMEYLDYVMSVKVVKDVEQAIQHINRYSTKHSESIITESKENALRFLNEVDSACVYWNASTRFTDGGVFGFGAEIGISTGKIHARGPMGLKEMTSYKYQIKGDGQIRS